MSSAKAKDADLFLLKHVLQVIEEEKGLA